MIGLTAFSLFGIALVIYSVYTGTCLDTNKILDILLRLLDLMIVWAAKRI
jgi:hypothetical protein